MLVPAYLGQCHQQHYDFPNRKTHILAAKAYYKDFLDLCTLYGINKVNPQTVSLLIRKSLLFNALHVWYSCVAWPLETYYS